MPGNVEHFKVAQAEHKVCCASVATSKISNSYKSLKETNQGLRESVARLNADLQNARMEVQTLKAKRHRKRPKSTNSSIKVKEEAVVHKKAQSTPALREGSDSTSLQSQPIVRRSSSILPCTANSLQAELQRALANQVADDALPHSLQRCSQDSETSHFGMPEVHRSNARLRTVSQPSPTVPAHFIGPFAGNSGDPQFPTTPISALYGVRRMSGSSVHSSLLRRNSQASCFTLATVGIGQIDEYLNLY